LGRSNLVRELPLELRLSLAIYLRSIIMDDWADKEAEAIVDRFVADESSADLLCLEQSIAEALRAAYEKGREDRS
jgi:hypothetical protein